MSNSAASAHMGRRTILQHAALGKERLRVAVGRGDFDHLLERVADNEITEHGAIGAERRFAMNDNRMTSNIFECEIADRHVVRADLKNEFGLAAAHAAFSAQDDGLTIA